MISLCRYYHGEKDCPFANTDKSYDMWHIERGWVDMAENGDKPTFSQSQCEEYWPDTAALFKSKASGLPQSFRDLIADWVIRGINMNAYLDPVELLKDYFGIPYVQRNPLKPKEPGTDDNAYSFMFNDGSFSDSYRKLCRYYHGEKECPYPLNSIQHTFWGIEHHWIEHIADDETKDGELLTAFLLDFPDGFAYIEEVNDSLKALLWDRYHHWGGDKDGFYNYLMSFIENAPTSD